jgi:dipeptidyl-peptidase-3
MVDESERKAFQKHRFAAYYIWVVLHEILGHGTGKLLVEDSSGDFNFDSERPPLNPLTDKPIDSWYLPGETWTGVFGDLATTVDECRAELVGAYLIDDAEILQLFGYTGDSEIKADDGKRNSQSLQREEPSLTRSSIQLSIICMYNWASTDFELWKITIHLRR